MTTSILDDAMGRRSVVPCRDGRRGARATRPHHAFTVRSPSATTGGHLQACWRQRGHERSGSANRGSVEDDPTPLRSSPELLVAPDQGRCRFPRGVRSRDRTRRGARTADEPSQPLRASRIQRRLGSVRGRAPYRAPRTSAVTSDLLEGDSRQVGVLLPPRDLRPSIAGLKLHFVLTPGAEHRDQQGLQLADDFFVIGGHGAVP